MLPGFEIYYKTLSNNLKSKNESIVALIHFILVSNNFKCIGLGEQFDENAKDAKGSELLPDKWNENDYFIQRYIETTKKTLLLVKIIPSDQVLLINVLVKDHDQIHATSINPSKFITDNYKEFDKLFLNDDSLNSLVNEIKKEILDNLDNKQSTTSTQNQSSSSDNNPLLINEPKQRPRINPTGSIPSSNYNDPLFPISRFPPNVGGADLDPLGRGIGGGMVMDPRRLPDHFNPPFNPIDPSFVDPLTGLRPGSIPTGARFDPIITPTPPSARGPPNRRGNRPQNHPDLEHFSPDYDDMFM